MSEKYLKVIEALGEVIINKQIDIDLLKYENQRLKEKIEAVEQYCNYYGKEHEKLDS